MEDKGLKGKSEFVANGHRYTIRKPGEAFTIERWNAYEKLSILYRFKNTPESVKEALQECHKTLNSLVIGANPQKTVLDVVYTLTSIIDAINERKSSASYYLQICTLFIVRDGENLAEWNEGMAEEKINDWQSEGLLMQDFFGLAVRSLNELASELIPSTDNG